MVAILNIPTSFLKTIHVNKEIKFYHSYLKFTEWIRENSAASFNIPVPGGKDKTSWVSPIAEYQAEPTQKSVVDLY